MAESKDRCVYEAEAIYVELPPVVDDKKCPGQSAVDRASINLVVRTAELPNELVFVTKVSDLLDFAQYILHKYKPS